LIVPCTYSGIYHLARSRIALAGISVVIGRRSLRWRGRGGDGSHRRYGSRCSSIMRVSVARD